MTTVQNNPQPEDPHILDTLISASVPAKTLAGVANADDIQAARAALDIARAAVTAAGASKMAAATATDAIARYAAVIHAADETQLRRYENSANGWAKDAADSASRAAHLYNECRDAVQQAATVETASAKAACLAGQRASDAAMAAANAATAAQGAVNLLRALLATTRG